MTLAKNTNALKLYLVTDASLCAQTGLIETVLQAIDGGVTMVQLRDKHASDKQLYTQACALHEAIDGQVPLLLNDRVDIAKKAGVEGAHIGQSDGSAKAARAILGNDAWLGLSVNNQAQMLAVENQYLDYLGIGPVFATNTKENHEPPIGIQGVRDLCTLNSLPKVAIGGIKAQHSAELLQTPIAGICVVSAICGTQNPKLAAQTLLHS